MPPEVKLSIVSPVYEAENIIPELVKRIEFEISKINVAYEIILVEDGSSDNSWMIIEGICKSNQTIKAIKLSRNFGQHYAASAGIKAASGQNIVLMDCDLQDNPKYIVALLEKLNSGFDIVFTKRIRRKHSFFKAITANIYNRIFRFISDRAYDINVGSLVAFNNKVGREFNKLNEQDRLYIQMLKWLGFNSTFIMVEHDKRYEGKSSYSFSTLLKMAIQSWTSHSDKLLRTSIYIGFALGLLSFIGILIIFILFFMMGLQPGWPSIIVSIFFSTGLTLISLGITGIYIGKTFQQVKDRPLYVVDKKININ